MERRLSNDKTLCKMQQVVENILQTRQTSCAVGRCTSHGNLFLFQSFARKITEQISKTKMRALQ